jgi:hypothetical protein
VTGFRPFFNPATGEWIEFTAVAEDTGGELITFNWRSIPGGLITEHIHPHQEERNPGAAEVTAVVELRPALRSKEFHEAVAGLAADGRTTLRGAPKNPLQLGATFWHFRHESRVTSPPAGVQNVMLPLLWAMARITAVRPYYERWDSRIKEPD